MKDIGEKPSGLAAPPQTQDPPPHRFAVRKAQGMTPLYLGRLKGDVKIFGYSHTYRGGEFHVCLRAEFL